MKKRIVLSLLCMMASLVASSETAAEVETEVPFFSAEFSAESYNTLIDVDKADKLLEENGSLEVFLLEAETLIKSYELEKTVGIRLAHRHTKLEDGEILADSLEMFNNNPALITRKVKVDSAKTVPASWMWDGKKYVPFEYSDDAAVKDAVKVLESKKGFFRDFYSLVSKHGLEDILYPAILYRSSQDDLLDGELIERTYVNPFASIIIAEKLFEEDIIQTTWGFHKKIRMARCFCFPGGDKHSDDHMEH